jgi:4-methyl-5(b-hydroxyethyl)-thiazole monophosphate biosynthesis
MIYIFLANGFEETEALTPLDYFRRCEELTVKSVGISSKNIVGGHGIKVECDITIDEVDLDETDMIVLPGGMPGTLNLETSEHVQEAIDYCALNDKYIAAICAAPSILGHKNMLHGKKAVCYPGFEQELYGAQIMDEAVCVDDNIITSKGAGTANQFAFELVKILCGEKRAEFLKAAVQWQE